MVTCFGKLIPVTNSDKENLIFSFGKENLVASFGNKKSVTSFSKIIPSTSSPFLIGIMSL